MWKDFFYYTKSERRAILCLLFLAVVLGTGCWFVRRFNPSTPLLSETDSLEIAAFLKQVDERDSVFRTSWNVPKKKIILQPFDPNTADSITLRSLGIPAFMVRNIMKYRAKGGRFRSPEAFAKVYGMDEKLFSSLKPYIVISTDKADEQMRMSTLTDKAETILRDSFPRQEKLPAGSVVDVNKADTALLKRIPGIGSMWARKIVNYRNRLGGLYSVEQLAELSNWNGEWNKWLSAEAPALKPILVNKAGLDQLRNHPYMDFYKAKAILEYRRKRGKIKSLSQLSLFEEFTEKDLSRLSPYLSFE
ncbi:helix-hairpin-helix domain-containing protein [uncultured Bacteroides sp.]|uniref:ComEA family DNA-binding protein n=1 Tax=uncultured Bacteroides sp. TaxID=162156 RepID=UPI00261912C7|nr:helix-hairpin-helix domain-containing protein [uncultured Bacteroides sp.]